VGGGLHLGQGEDCCAVHAGAGAEPLAEEAEDGTVGVHQALR